MTVVQYRLEAGLADIENLVVKRLGRLGEDGRLGPHVVAATLESAADRSVAHDRVAEFVVEAKLRRDRLERLGFVVVRRHRVDDRERVVRVAGIEGDAILLLTRSAKTEVGRQLRGESVAPVAEEGDRVGERFAVGRAEDAVQENILDQPPGLAVEIVSAENARDLAAS